MYIFDVCILAFVIDLFNARVVHRMAFIKSVGIISGIKLKVLLTKKKLLPAFFSRVKRDFEKRKSKLYPLIRSVMPHTGDVSSVLDWKTAAFSCIADWLIGICIAGYVHIYADIVKQEKKKDNLSLVNWIV